MSENGYDLIVIGAGPAGHAAALHASGMGKKVLCVEKKRVGGTCLNKGCIPTKALVKAAHYAQSFKDMGEFGFVASFESFDLETARLRLGEISTRLGKGVEFAFKRAGVDFVLGEAKILDAARVSVKKSGGEVSEFAAKKILIATGSAPRIPQGVSLGERVVDSEGALALSRIPKSAVIIGAGAIGCEFAHVWNSFGAHVTLVEMRSDILPGCDADLSRALARNFSKRGMTVYTSSSAKKIEDCGKTARALVETPKGELELGAEVVLVCAGVRADLDGLFECPPPELDEKGFIKTDKIFETSVKNVHACGDIAGAPWLAHAASYQAVCTVEGMFGRFAKNYDASAIPACVHCGLEIAKVGVGFDEAQRLGLEIKSAKVPFSASSKAAVDGTDEGFVRLIAAENDGTLVGASIAGENASELISICALAIANRLTVCDISKSVFAHPTLSEALHAAASALEREHYSR